MSFKVNLLNFDLNEHYQLIVKDILDIILVVKVVICD